MCRRERLKGCFGTIFRAFLFLRVLLLPLLLVGTALDWMSREGEEGGVPMPQFFSGPQSNEQDALFKDLKSSAVLLVCSSEKVLQRFWMTS